MVGSVSVMLIQPSFFSQGGLYTVWTLIGFFNLSPVTFSESPSHNELGDFSKYSIGSPFNELWTYTAIPPFCQPIWFISGCRV